MGGDKGGGGGVLIANERPERWVERRNSTLRRIAQGGMTGPRLAFPVLIDQIGINAMTGKRLIGRNCWERESGGDKKGNPRGNKEREFWGKARRTARRLPNERESGRMVPWEDHNSKSRTELSTGGSRPWELRLQNASEEKGKVEKSECRSERGEGRG